MNIRKTPWQHRQSYTTPYNGYIYALRIGYEIFSEQIVQFNLQNELYDAYSTLLKLRI